MKILYFYGKIVIFGKLHSAIDLANSDFHVEFFFFYLQLCDTLARWWPLAPRQDLYKLLCAEGTDDLSANELCTGVAELKGNVRDPGSEAIQSPQGWNIMFDHPGILY